MSENARSRTEPDHSTVAGATVRGHIDHCAHCPDHCRHSSIAAKHYTACPVCP